MTTDELLRMLAPMSRMTVYRHLRALRIKPLGIRQRPQNWPDFTPEKIRERLGVTNNIEVTAATTEKPEWLDALKKAKPAKLTTITKLRDGRKQGRAKRCDFNS